jgi:hypothetical protein
MFGFQEKFHLGPRHNGYYYAVVFPVHRFVIQCEWETQLLNQLMVS